MKDLFHRLYASEINAGLQSFWDGGWTVWIGDNVNGRHEITFDENDLDRVETWLAAKAAELYPDSKFAKEKNMTPGVFPAKTPHEKRSGIDRIKNAEGLISQLPTTHDGRNTWLLNYGTGEEAVLKRERRGLVFDEFTQAAEAGR